MSGHRQNHREGVAVHELIMSFRGDMETTIAVFIAGAVDVLGRIAHSDRVAPWSECLTWIMARRPSALLRRANLENFFALPARTARRPDAPNSWRHSPHTQECRH